jgi:hypothetical protein
MPQIINIDHYAGNTLTIHVAASVALIGGREFSAQVRSDPTSTRLDAAFGIILTPTGADLVLLSEDSQRLAKRGLYEGFWDVQLSMAGADPVTTLGYGELRLHPDVTREPL